MAKNNNNIQVLPTLNHEPQSNSDEALFLESITNIIKYIGEDPTREGLQETPQRVLKAYKQFFSGYNINPAEILAKRFCETSNYSGPIILNDIEFVSYCEHHILPFYGKAHIGYIPNQEVVGLSKLARLVEVFAKRLQLQERMTIQIADAINKYLQPKAVAVLIEAKHTCLNYRGVEKQSAMFVTQQFLGAEQHELKNIFQSTISGNK